MQIEMLLFEAWECAAALLDPSFRIQAVAHAIDSVSIAPTTPALDPDFSGYYPARIYGGGAPVEVRRYLDHFHAWRQTILLSDNDPGEPDPLRILVTRPRRRFDMAHRELSRLAQCLSEDQLCIEPALEFLEIVAAQDRYTVGRAHCRTVHGAILRWASWLAEMNGWEWRRLRRMLVSVPLIDLGLIGSDLAAESKRSVRIWRRNLNALNAWPKRRKIPGRPYWRSTSPRPSWQGS